VLKEIPLPSPTWHHQPEHHRRHCLYPQEANPQTWISKDTTGNLMTGTVVVVRSELTEYELRDRTPWQKFSLADRLASIFSGLVTHIHEESYSR
jgi:hypothetical protein